MGVIHASATTRPGAIIAIDDFGGEFDPHLARHLVGELRRTAGQLIASTHSANVVSKFSPDEVVRLRRGDDRREAIRGRRPSSRSERVSQRYLTGILLDSLSASAAIIVEGHQDRIAISALIERLVAIGALESIDGAGISLVGADGSGEAPKVARAASELGIYSVVLLDNDTGTDAATDDAVQRCLADANAVVRLPARTAIERLLVGGAADGTLRRVLDELDRVFGDLALAAGWQTKSGRELQQLAVDTLHRRAGALHGAYVWALDESEIPSAAVAVLRELREVAVTRRSGLTEL
jgi:hypothetical protein